jgi:methionine sulfoxide reductase heme-binding subunit
MTRWKLFGLLAALVSLVAAVAYALAPDQVQALQYAVRATARTSFLLFLAAFTASPLLKLLHSAFAKALTRERRFIGLSFAYSMLLHALVLTAYIIIAPTAFWHGRTAATNVPGSIGYLMIVLLSVTSFAVPARLVGPKNWKVLHRTGIWIIAVIFAASFLTRVSHHAVYVVPGAVMVVAMVLRIAVRINSTFRAKAPLT